MKKMILDFDSSKCCACGACAIACMDQNDYDPKTGSAPFRTIFETEHADGSLSPAVMAPMAVATSIDALAVGKIGRASCRERV